MAAAVLLLQPVGVPVLVSEGVGGGVALLDSEVLPVLLGEAPADRLAVGEADCVGLAEEVLLAVAAGVPVAVAVAVPVGVCEGVGKAVALLVSETLGVTEALAP